MVTPTTITPTQSFGMKNAVDLFTKLNVEVLRLKTETSRLDAGHLCFNIAVTAWHLADWYWNDIEPAARIEESGGGVADFDAFKRRLRTNPCIAACADIANASKHLTSEKFGKVKQGLHSIDVSAEETYVGQPQVSFGLGEETRYGPDGWDFLILVDGKRSRAVDIFTDARNFWRDKLQAHGLLKTMEVDMHSILGAGGNLGGD